MPATQRKSKMGRPPLPEAERRDAAVNFRCRVEEAARVETLAEMWGVDRREAVIRAVEMALEREQGDRCADCGATAPAGAPGWEVSFVEGTGRRARCPLHSDAGRARRAREQGNARQ